MRIAEVIVELGRFIDLQDFRTQVRHVDPPRDGVHPVHRVFEHHIRIAGFELNLGDGLEEFARVDLGFADALVIHHLMIFLSDRDFRERHAIDLFHVMRREQVHIGVFLGQLKGDVRNHHAKAQRFNTDFLIRVFALGVEKPHDVGVVGVQIDRARALPRAQLVGVGKAVLQQFHHRDHARGLVLDAFDRRAMFADIGQQQRHASAALGQLQGRVDAAPDAFHVIFQPQQEARDQLSTRRFACVQKGGGGGLESAIKDFFHEGHRQRLIPARQCQRGHDNAVLIAFKEPLSVAGFQRVRGVILERAQKGREPELFGKSRLPDLAHEVLGILVQNGLFIIAFGHQIAQLFI